MFAALAAQLVPTFISQIFKSGENIFHDYQQGKISLAQFQTQIAVVAQQEMTKVLTANADMVAKTFESFTELAKTSLMVRVGWLAAVLSQVFVLTFYQVGVPFIVWYWGGRFPSPSDQLLEFGYGLLVLLVGGGAIAIRRPSQPATLPPQGNK